MFAGFNVILSLQVGQKNKLTPTHKNPHTWLKLTLTQQKVSSSETFLTIFKL